MTNKALNKQYKSSESFFDDIIVNYDRKGTNFGNQDRNSLRLFEFRGQLVNVKSFKVPNLINQIVYRFFRKSKAQRSYEYANELKSKGIGTPEPIGYYEFCSFFLFKKSFYISEQQECDLTYRELTTDLQYVDHENILRAFTRFTFNLHEKNVLFLDHSPGNTLIKKVDNNYAFYLVDLNRMKFKSLSFEERIHNFSRLTTHKSMIEVMSDEYAKLINEDYERVFNLMWKTTLGFQEKYHRKQKLKRKIKFWKNYN